MSDEIRRSSKNDWMKRYQTLKDERMREMQTIEPSPETLHYCHETLMKKAVRLAIEKIESEWGSPPTHFAFFVMGSAGRSEQSYWSDQDHGLVYDGNQKEYQPYFLRLGAEIVDALELAGYDRCDGLVMASNQRWCKSLEDWHKQIENWLEDDTWEHLRYILTFFDSRSLIGDHSLLREIKENLFEYLRKNERLLIRFCENTGRLRKGIGPFGQFIIETKGEHQGKFDFKQIVLFPYVNGLRLLALKENIYETSTLERFRLLPEKYQKVKHYQDSFEELLRIRLQWQRGVTNYDDIHYLHIKQFSNEDKRQLKKWTQEGQQLYKHIETLMGRRD